MSTSTVAAEPSAATPPPARPSLSRGEAVLLAVLPVVLLRFTLLPVADPDVFWHVRAGEYLWDTWAFAAPEPWSAFADKTWVLHEWLPELALAGMHSTFGWSGVAWLTAAGVAALFAATYLSCRRWAPVLPSLIATTAAMFGAAASLAPRPQLVSFVFLAVTVYAWLSTAADRRARWWLVPLQWFWACSHGMWFVGVLVGVVVVVGMALDRQPRDALRRLVTIPVLGAVVAVLTPAGPALLAAPLHVGGMTRFVSEWRAPSLKDPDFVMVILLVALVVVVWARGGRTVRWSTLLLLGLGVAWTVLYARTVALGAVIVAPLAAQALQSLHPDHDVRARRREGRWLTGGIALSLLLAAVALPQVASTPAMPHGLNPALDALPTGTVVFNEYSQGGWLLWRHRQLSVVIDPRTEVYPASYVHAHVAALNAAPGWRGVVAGSGASYALLPESAPLTAALLDGKWQTVAADGGYVLLRRGG